MKQSIKVFNNRGQSILELAIFGSIVLFLLGVLIQYGVGLNYQQQLSMQTFRKALQISKESARNIDSPHVSLTVVKDSPMPDPSNPYGVCETSPVGAQAVGSLSRYLAYEYDITPSELPKIDLMINDTHKTYTTADFGHYVCSGKVIKKKETNYEKLPFRWDTRVGPCWDWEEVEDIELDSGDYIDIDNDGKAETIVKTEPEGDDEDKEEFWYLDFQEGDIDISIDIEEGIPHGLQPEYTKDVEITNTRIEKTEDHSGISIARRFSITETIKRMIKTRNKDEEIISEISREGSSNWQTNW